ncbi:UbiA family prenyltransferase [Aeoliella mucimassa]|uniref:Prenyltransferase n=1 Tax=Aeoliella mucimassa TaxID=2527972 RepID=A0A518AK45_9BACT|nr:UbiA family prenyltransferase [Aeoliella mucimassa]QDU55099.1 prenyltransferase [Aeoliella mucimassa]
MSDRELTAETPFWRRLLAYADERFPLVGHGVLIVSYYSSNSLLAQVLTSRDESLHYNRSSLMGAIVLFCFFFHLRVFDEHKDYADDCQYHPERVLQRGLVTLRQLTLLGIAAIGIELVLAGLWQPLGKPAALVAVSVALGYSLLMLKEFFCSRWLGERFIWYAVSHMLIMPLLAMIPFSFSTGEYLWNAPPWFWWYAFVGFFVTFNWEISRKIRAPEAEIEGVDTYSSLFGPRVAATTVLVIRVIDTGMVAAVGYHLQLSMWFYLALIVMFLATLTSYVAFIRQMTAKAAKHLERVAGLYIIAFDLALAIELIRKFGVTFTW